MVYAVLGCKEGDKLTTNPCSVCGKPTHHLCAVDVFVRPNSAINENPDVKYEYFFGKRKKNEVIPVESNVSVPSQIPNAPSSPLASPVPDLSVPLSIQH
ncbi:Hypothetical protein PHPALM_701 [Phytophthora palmivora]|uniref:Uncharacterized protein n=1 Tax=Phytophthora palmivora TaxID=4796 RepID=A0A2P4YU70_9STRA|nr:Hypothetical protein PHPALM_701 [Phytophthora palmivora]